MFNLIVPAGALPVPNFEPIFYGPEEPVDLPVDLPLELPTTTAAAENQTEVSVPILEEANEYLDVSNDSLIFCGSFPDDESTLENDTLGFLDANTTVAPGVMITDLGLGEICQSLDRWGGQYLPYLIAGK